jgi:hypothetical protein
LGRRGTASIDNRLRLVKPHTPGERERDPGRACVCRRR